MNAYRSRPLRFPWPPVFYGFAIFLSLVLGHTLPMKELTGSGWVLSAAGSMLILLAAAIDLWALVTLREGHTTVMPHRYSAHLVTSGPFRFSRNPIYLGYTMLTVGLGLVTSNTWFLVSAPASALITYLIAIRAEEMHLLARFGFDFERYRNKTRCWL